MRDLEYEIKAKDKSGPAFDSAEARARRFNTQISNTSVGLNLAETAARSFAAAFTVTAITGFASAAREVIKQAADMVDLSNKVGVTTEQLQRLQYGFELNGVAAEDTDQILTQWAKRIGDAYTGSGKLAAIFKANNISLTDSTGHLRSSVDLMREYADLVANAGSEQARTALSFEGFGKAGAQMVLALHDGKKGFDELMRAADDAGGVIDDRLMQSAADIDDRFTKMWHNFEINAESAILTAVDGIDGLLQKMRAAEEKRNLAALGTEMGKLAGLTGTIKGGRLADKSPIGQRISDAFDNTALEDSDANNAMVRALRDRYAKHTIIPDDTPKRQASTKAAKDQETAYQRVIRSLDDERAMLGMNATEQQILIEQRRAGVTATSAEGKTIAEKVRLLEQEKSAHEQLTKSMRDSAELGRDVFGGMIDDLRNGAKATDIMTNALGKMESKLLDMMLDNLFMGADGKSGGLFGNLLGSLFNSTGATADPWAGMRTTGAAQAKAISAPLAKSTINIINNGTSRIQTDEKTDSSGNRLTTLTIDDQVASAIARPGSQSGKAIGAKFGARQTYVKR